MMATARATVAVVGVGQIGSRHLQGLAGCETSLDVHLVDPWPSAIEVAAGRWAEVGGDADRLIVHDTTAGLPPGLDVAVVACSAAERPAVVGEVAATTRVRHWVLEKVLATSGLALVAISQTLRDAEGAWVNTPRRTHAWYRRLAAAGGAGRPVHLSVRGGSWGLACNAVHYLDLAAWWSGTTVSAVDTARLDGRWLPARRPGYSEIGGTLAARLSDGGSVELTDDLGGGPRTIHLETEAGSWTIDEPGEVARRDDGLVVEGRYEPQSEETGRLVDEILTTGDCGLPTLEESSAQHGPLLAALLAHYRRTMDESAVTVPIT
ncbi:MAG: hypothetical protein VX488_04340 [Actinomycetota bacterium]|nr:hypothetical protein [Actinomycetota bacterium]